MKISNKRYDVYFNLLNNVQLHDITHQYQEELDRRKALGQQYSRVLATQLRIIQTLEERRKRHRILFDAFYREAMKTIEWIDVLISETPVDPMVIER